MQDRISLAGVVGVTSLANLLVAGIIVLALMRNQHSAATAILTGAGYYTVSNLLSTLTISGALTGIATARMEQITARKLHVLQYRAAPQVAPGTGSLPPVTDPLLTLGAPAVESAPPLGDGHFVPPVELTVARDAVLWAMALYGPDGKADPAKVNLKGGTEPAGRLRVAAPASAAKEYLLIKRVLERVDHGYRLNLGRYPTADALRELIN